MSEKKTHAYSANTIRRGWGWSLCGHAGSPDQHADNPTCGHCAPKARGRRAQAAMTVNIDHGGHVDMVESEANSDDWIEGHPAWV